MKKQLCYWLALPFVFFIFNCSHLPLGSHERDQGATKVSPRSGSASVEAAQDGNPSAAIGSNEKHAVGAPDDTADETVDSAAADTASNDDIDADDCQDGDEDCQSDDKEPAAEKDSQSSLDEALQFCDLSQDLWQKGELDNALEALDKAYALICEVDTQQDPKLIQEKEDLRFLISKRILEIYASRNIVVPGDHDEIPMEKNKHVDAEIALFTTGPEKDAFLAAYKRSGMYRPYIVNALKKAGLPIELSWLPLIESGFKVNAFSRARALGLWQFIPSTGYKFGLVRNSYIDERLDFIKSTHAAINYLKELHNIFGDWATVLAAYNCGEGRVLQVIRTQHVNYLDDFWDLYQRLPLETARYVPRFFATLQIIKHPKKYGLDKVELDSPIDFEVVEVNRQVHLKEISKALDLDLDELESFNPELRYHILPPEPYKLRLPKGKKNLLLSSLDSLPTCTLPQRSYIYHRVRSGENLAVIAHRYHTSVGRIMRANGLRRSNFIRTGRRLKIPVSRMITAAADNAPAAHYTGNHRVIPGDSLWNLANRYNTTVEQIKDLNNLSSSNLYIGQRLKIPGAAPDQLSTYFVKIGDSPYTIAQDHKMPLRRFLSINGLSRGSRIYPGQKLLIE